MTLDEARQILGVSAGAGRDEVKRAHRRLALAFHPDHHKGSTQFDEFQKQINVARDTLNREIDRLDESVYSETDTAMETPASHAAAPPQAPRTRTRPPAPPGVDEYREISFPFLTMLRGGRTRINVPRPEGAQEMFVDVPRALKSAFCSTSSAVAGGVHRQGTCCCASSRSKPTQCGGLLELMRGAPSTLSRA